MATNLPTDIDATYPDRGPGDKYHQQLHDQIHAYTNDHDSAVDPHGDRAYADSLATSEEGFKAYRSTAQALVAATETKIIFDVESRDDGGDYDPATGDWTVPATGWYDVAGHVHYTVLADGEEIRARFYVNGAPRAVLGYTKVGAAGGAAVGGSRPLHLTAGEVVSVYGYRGNAGNVLGADFFTYFTAKRRY